MNQELLIFTIGPVKSFIQGSRKVRDLYAGSYLLGHLMKQLGDELESKLKQGSNIIFPSRNAGGHIPNRLIADLRGYSLEEARRLGEEMEEYVRQAFYKVCTDVIKASISEITLPMERQIQSFLEVYWVVEAYEDYTAGYRKAVESLHAVKRIRRFTQMDEPAGRKCSLYPELNAIFARRRANKQGGALVLPRYIARESLVELKQQDTLPAILNEKEALSSIAFAKRGLDDYQNKFKEEFPHYSLEISSVAYMLLRRKLKNQAFAEELPMLKNQASEAIYDLQSGFVLNTEEYSSKEIRIAEAIYRKIQEEEIFLSPYYAIVKIDGDSLGNIYQDLGEHKLHQALSEALCKFAEDAETLVKKNDGICIYAGGEDILAFLPLDTVFPAILQMRRVFRETMIGFIGEKKEGLTFSAGVVVAHLMSPMNAVLKTAEIMEREAKSVDKNKNGFAISVYKRSGETVVVKSGFGDQDAKMNVLWRCIQALRNKNYSRSFVYGLMRVLSPLINSDEKCLNQMVEVLILQALCKAERSLSDEEAQNIKAMFYECYCKEASKGLAHYLDMLNVILFLSREVCDVYSTSCSR